MKYDALVAIRSCLKTGPRADSDVAKILQRLKKGVENKKSKIKDCKSDSSCKIKDKHCRIVESFLNRSQTNRQTNGWTDRRTLPLIEMR